MRFPGFEGEWELKKLSAYLYENKERNRNGEFNKSDVLSVSGDCGIVNQIELLGRSFAGKSVADYHVVRTDDIVYTKSPLKEYPYGIVKYNNGQDGIVSTLYAVYHHKDNVDGQFVEYYFTNPQRTNRYFKPIVRIGAKHDMKIGNEEVLDSFVVFPGLEEQRKITEMLSLLDLRIAIQNKVIEDLKKLKTAIVEKMFKQSKTNGRLGDFIEQVSVRNKNGLYSNVLSVSNKQGFVKQSEQFEDRTVASEDTSNYKIVKRNNFAYNPARINVGSIARLTKFDVGIVSPMYVCFRTKDGIIPEYMEAFFTSQQFFYEMMKRLEGSVRLCLSYEGLCNIPVYIPNMNKQIVMGQNISLILSKIGLEIEYLGRLHQQKQYLLRKMFI